MASCKLCTRNGIFLSVNQYGLCNTCNSQMLSEAKFLLPQINKFMKKADEDKSLKVRVSSCERAVQLSEKLFKYEKIGIPIIKPLPSLIIKTYTDNRNALMEKLSKRKPPTQMFGEYPLGIRMMLLMHYGDENYPSAYYKEASKLENIVVDRNLSGKELEKEGEIEKAIALYESNVFDLVDTPHPYDRLRIIYTKKKQYTDAIRVCQAYIEMCRQSSHAALVELDDKEFAAQLADTGKFPEYINKIKSKLTTRPLNLQ